jgi:predicted dinucleotide-binding enzyme
MQIGIIGAGFIARAVATIATDAGHDVMVSNSRTPDTLFSLVISMGCQAGTPAQAAEFGDIVLVAIPLKAYEDVPVAELRDKLVLDACNYYPERDGNIGELDRDETTTSELLSRHLLESRIIKAFNAITAADIVGDRKPAGAPGRRALPLAGDDADAKKAVTALLDEFGFDSIDAGPLVEGRRFQRGPRRTACQWIPGRCERRWDCHERNVISRNVIWLIPLATYERE